ncbi:MAG TPA: metallophosphoesterase [Gemmatimonadales bacterium]|nr:metallophosphoesterase [Gemmatimonadales bacterium]
MPPRPTRRQFIGAATGALAAAAVGDGFLREPTAIELTRLDLRVPGLDPRLAGLRLACVTDVHLDHGISRAARAALALLQRERPDVVVLIGDICNDQSDLPDLAAWAREARGSRATFATLGNWEHDGCIDRALAERWYGAVGVELLYNSVGHVVVGDAKLTLVGIDDPVLGEPNVAEAVRGIEAADPTIWIVHAPGFVDELPRDRFPQPAAILAGHTHGGQVRLPFYTPYTPNGSGRFRAGWYHDTLAPLYVSRGIGTIVIPARLFCPPELPIFTLR